MVNPKILQAGKTFLEAIYLSYEVVSIDVVPKKDGYAIKGEMKEKFDPRKRYQATIVVALSIVEY